MKKILCLLSLLLFCGFLFSCATDEEDDESQTMGCYLANGKVYLAIPKVDNTLIIQIYRQDEKGVIYNIGEIQPSYISSTISYAFEDELAAERTYTYRVFYLLYKAPGYFATDWTSPIKVQGSPYNTEPVPSVTTGAYLDYDDKAVQLTMTNGEIFFQNKADDSIFKNYILKLGFQCSGSTYLVKLGDVYDEKTGFNDFTENSKLSLNSKLPSSWKNKTISQVGAIYEKEYFFPTGSTESNYLYKVRYWSTPVAVTMKKDGKKITEFTIKNDSDSDNNYIYTPPIDTK